MNKNIICDAHNHFSQCQDKSFPVEKYFCCQSFKTQEEFESGSFSSNVINCFGIHPWDADVNKVPYVEKLLKDKKINCVGEIGIDFAKEEYKINADKQIECFEKQIDIAIKYNVPVVLHVLKGIDVIHKFSGKLKKLPSVIFHSYTGNLSEAEHILNKGINAYFSFGKSLIAGRNSVIDCVSGIELNRILIETDAPFQKLPGEEYTKLEDILNVYEKISRMRNIEINDLCETVYTNFKRAFLFP